MSRLTLCLSSELLKRDTQSRNVSGAISADLKTGVLTCSVYGSKKNVARKAVFCALRKEGLSLFEEGDRDKKEVLTVDYGSMVGTLELSQGKLSLFCSDGCWLELSGDYEELRCWRNFISFHRPKRVLASSAATLEGWLMKKKEKSGILRSATQKKRWCVVLEDCMKYYEKPKGEELGVLPLLNASVRLVEESEGPMLELRTDSGAYCFYRAADGPELRTWHEAVQGIVNKFAGMSGKLSKMAGASRGGDKASWPSFDPHRPEDVPEFVGSAVETITQRGVTETGIFRISGDQDMVAALCGMWMRGRKKTLETLEKEVSLSCASLSVTPAP